MEKIKTDKIIIVEGKYDKIKLSSLIDGTIITTSGFSIFNNKEKCALLKKLSAERGIVILTDSDGAGFVIRNKIKNIVGNNENITNIYIPQIAGKEQRKKNSSKEGFLGVEGVDAAILKSIFEKSGLCSEHIDTLPMYTKADLYAMGFSGGSESSAKRDEICLQNGLPKGMSANAFLESVNILRIKLV